MFLFRPFTIAVLLVGAWLGMRAEQVLDTGRCRNAGGIEDARGICTGVPRQ